MNISVPYLSKKYAISLFNVVKLQVQLLAILLALIANTKIREMSWDVTVNICEIFWAIKSTIQGSYFCTYSIVTSDSVQV